VQLSFPDTNSSLEQIIRKNEDTREAIRTSFSGVSSFIKPLHDSPQRRQKMISWFYFPGQHRNGAVKNIAEISLSA